MKKTGILLTLAASLLLTGCSAMLERDYSHVTPHNAAPTTEGDPSILRAESYQELVNALVYLVNLGAERGTIRLYTDSEDVEDFLSDACLEVVQEDPLGAYCVEFITYSVDPVVTFSQAEVDITYRRTREQVASIVQATGAAAIRSELGTALTSFAPERTLRIHYFEEDEAFIQDWGCRISPCPSTPTAAGRGLWRSPSTTRWTTPSSWPGRASWPGRWTSWPRS